MCGGALCLVLPTLGLAQSDAIDDFVRSEMDRQRIPGLSLAVTRKGAIVKRGHYGLANVELNVPVTDDTKFEIASMSKQFTDAAILLLAEQGKLGLDDPIERFLSDVPTSWKAITIRQLMNHTAGVRDDWDEDNSFFLRNQTNEDFLKALYAFPLKFPPGQGWAYGAGPFVLGIVIEKISGRPYREFMQQRIFEPLGMTATSVNDVDAVLPHRASGYRWSGNAWTRGVRISPTAQGRGDVGIITTAADLAKWDAALNTTKLLSRKSLEAMFTPVVVNNRIETGSALGWFVVPWRGDRLIMHNGGFRTGFSSTHKRYVDRGLTVIVLTNLFRVNREALTTGIAGFYERDYGLIARMRVERDPDPSRTGKVFSFLAAASEGRRDIGGVAERSLGLYPIERWQAGLKGINALTFIACQNTEGRRNMYDETAVCFYKADGAPLPYWSAGFTRSGQIAFVMPEL
jgi:CubicO group peptidase (beta-lactamase class C family)